MKHKNLARFRIKLSLSIHTRPPRFIANLETMLVLEMSKQHDCDNRSTGSSGGLLSVFYVVPVLQPD
jgi:hypothetical protein